MPSNALNKTKLILSQIFCACFLTVSVFPGMLFTGKLLLQVLLTLFFVLLYSFVVNAAGIGLREQAFAEWVMIIFWIIIAFVEQILFKGTFLIFRTPWAHTFYYDSIGMIFIALTVTILFQRIKAFCSKDSGAAEEYRRFYSVASAAYITYYIVALLYCFVICRTPSAEREAPNLIPFNTLKWTFFSGLIDYERLILFFGNIAIFLPLGFLMYEHLRTGKKRIILFLFPVVLSSSIEISQYVFNMGNPDVDDVILNVLGFYLGFLLKIAVDRLLPIRSE